MDAQPFGIDFGGSGIKGAPVDLGAGDFAADRVKIKTPRPSTPEAVATVFVELLSRFPDSTGPSASRSRESSGTGWSSSAANIDDAWIGTDADALFTRPQAGTYTSSTTPTRQAWPRCGTARRQAAAGLVVVTTLGTGIGSAIVYDGVLVPNSELGHLEVEGHNAESRAANSAREREGLSFPEWAERLTVYYRTVERLLSPDLIVVGGGVSKDAAEFLHLVDIATEIVPAKLENRAGIVGAALWAAESLD